MKNGRLIVLLAVCAVAFAACSSGGDSVGVEDPWGLAWGADGSISALLSSKRFGEPDEESPRRVVFVLDRSGSMSGRPIEQAKKAIEAGIAAMRPQDLFSIVAFDHETEALSRELLEATDKNRKRARRFLEFLDARGGTELANGVDKAARMIREGGGDLLLLTDGQVFGTADILKTVRETGARIHALGIGSASQDRFLSQLGRETGGRSRVLTPRERVDLALLDLFASVSPPVALDVRIEAAGEVLATQNVHTGSPLLVREEGAGSEIEASWSEGKFSVPVQEAPAVLRETLRLLEGAARITAVESTIGGVPVGEDAGTLEALSRQYGLASRVMALVAVVNRESDRAGELPQTKVVPVGMPLDLHGDVYFGEAASIGGPAFTLHCEDQAPETLASEPPFFRRLFSKPPKDDIALAMAPPPESEEDLLLEDASRLEADGGMPGDSAEERFTASLDLLERLINHGSTPAKGPFRHHVRRLLDFLNDAVLSEEQIERLAEVVGLIEA